MAEEKEEAGCGSAIVGLVALGWLIIVGLKAVGLVGSTSVGCSGELSTLNRLATAVEAASGTSRRGEVYRAFSDAKNAADDCALELTLDTGHKHVIKESLFSKKYNLYRYQPWWD